MANFCDTSKTCTFAANTCICAAKNAVSRFAISRLNIHRLVITAVMLAVKFFDDIYYSNAHYAKVGGVQLKEINDLEVNL